MGIDLGERRIGIAVSDATGTLASPAGMVERDTDRVNDHVRLVATATDLGAEEVVVGLPLSLSGRAGPAARRVLDEVEELRDAMAGVGLRVHLQDERLSTVTAERSLRDARGRPGGRARAVARRKSGAVDQAAATVLLQAWLDRNRGG